MSKFNKPEPLQGTLDALGVSYPSSVGSLINGDRVAGEDASWDLIYPATGEAFGSATGLSTGQVNNAVDVAAQCFNDGLWKAKPLAERQEIMRQAADLIVEHGDELAALQAAETGIPFGQFRYVHMPRSVQNIRFFVDAASTLAGQTYQQTGRYLSLTLYEPIGVGVVIAPWNAPLVLSTMKIAACLITGNSCIIKPSEYTPYSLLRLAEIMIQAGVPKGAIQLVNGQGATTGDALVSHPAVGAVNFVGGTETGKKIMTSAADGLKKISLELGGKSANIILDDADIDQAIDGSLLGSFAGNGEQCLSGSRILVHRAIAEEFIEKFVARTKNLTIGDPFADSTEIGPLAFGDHFQRVQGFVANARSEGAEILCGGDIPQSAKNGFFLEPVVARVSSNDLGICQDEIFGPFVTIMVVDDLDQAIEIANQSKFGLASYVWTQNIAAMMKVTREIQAGTVWVNTPMTRDLRAPFGGYKMSGLGRDGLPGSIELFTEQKTVMIPTGTLDIPQLGKFDPE